MPPPASTQDAARCPGCGYELRGLGARVTTCPECGSQVDPDRLRLIRAARLRLGITLLAVCSPVAVLSHLLQAAGNSGGGNDSRSMFSNDWWLLLPASSAGLLGIALVLQNGRSGLSDRRFRGLAMLCAMCGCVQTISAGMTTVQGGSVLPLSYFVSASGPYFTFMDLAATAADSAWQLGAIALLILLPGPGSRVLQSLGVPAARWLRRISIAGWVVLCMWLLILFEEWAQRPFLTLPSIPPGLTPPPSGWTGEQPAWFRELITAARAIVHIGGIAALTFTGLVALVARTHLGAPEAASTNPPPSATTQP